MRGDSNGGSLLPSNGSGRYCLLNSGIAMRSFFWENKVLRYDVEFRRTFSGFPPFPPRHVRFESNSSKRFQLRSSIAARRRLCHVGRIKAWIPLPPPLRSRLDPIPPSPQRESLPGMRFTTALVAASRRRHVSLKYCLKSWRFPFCCFCFHSFWNKKQEDSLFFFRERGPEDGLLAEASP